MQASGEYYVGSTLTDFRELILKKRKWMLLALRMRLPQTEKCRGCRRLDCWSEFMREFERVMNDSNTHVGGLQNVI